IITHCEDTPTIDAALAEYRAKYGDDIPARFHPDIRSREACLKSTRLALELARRHGTRLHVLHISTADELALFERGPLVRADGSRKRITAETCIHFLRFERADYERLGHQIKCNPAIKDASDRAALLQALAEDVVDVLATDHAPHTWEEKQAPYVRAPSGLPLVQFALVAALECVHEGHFDAARVVQKFAHAPAQLFDVKERGFLREGYYADLVLVEDTPFTVRREDVLSRCGWSPFEGSTFRSRIASTWVNGTLARDGSALVGARRGRRREIGRPAPRAGVPAAAGPRGRARPAHLAACRRARAGPGAGRRAAGVHRRRHGRRRRRAHRVPGQRAAGRDGAGQGAAGEHRGLRRAHPAHHRLRHGG